jgi:hypothetical protein
MAPNSILIIFDAGAQTSIQPLQALTAASPYFAAQLAFPIEVRPTHPSPLKPTPQN